MNRSGPGDNRGVRDELELVLGSGDPVSDLALEAFLLERSADGVPRLLVCSWPEPVAVIGYAQDPADLDLAWCRSADVPVLRRLTGGTGVVHRCDLGVSLVLAASHPWGVSIRSLYGRFLDAVELALRAAGSEVARPEVVAPASRERSPICFENQLAETLVVGGRKAVGCAQARRRSGVLVHAAVLLGLDVTLWAGVFGVPEKRIRAALAPALEGVEPFVVARAVAERLAGALGLEAVERPAPAVPAELVERYREPRWAPLSTGSGPGR